MTDLASVILNRLNSLVVVIDHEGKLRYLNPAVRETLGFESEALLGDSWWNYTGYSEKEISDSRYELNRAIRLYQRKYISQISFERCVFAVNGDEKHIHWNLTPGPENTIIAIGYDITERKNAEKKLELKNQELEQQHYHTISGIQYARRIQQSILPEIANLKKYISDAFVLYKPKDIVSGDFYWMNKKENLLHIAVADCTGHGVPGAMMSVMANSLLDDVIVKRKVNNTAVALEEIDNDLQVTLNKNKQGYNRDGMDLALLQIDLKTLKAKFSAAMRMLFVVRENEITEVKGDKYPIGFFDDHVKTFTEQELQLLPGDQLYMFSDGYVDQFGGEHDKKFNKKNFRELLLATAQMSMNEQESFLEYVHNNWKQNGEQTDDILVLGVKI